MWPPDPALDEENIAFTRRVAAAMRPWATGQVYLNFIGDEGLHRVETSFGPERFQRLRAVKRVWDPDNVFRHNFNIPPADGPGEGPGDGPGDVPATGPGRQREKPQAHG
jgi:FAD/FMN-containing dehydrogenase